MVNCGTREWDALQDDSMLEGDVLPLTAGDNEDSIAIDTLEAWSRIEDKVSASPRLVLH